MFEMWKMINLEKRGRMRIPIVREEREQRNVSGDTEGKGRRERRKVS